MTVQDLVTLFLHHSQQQSALGLQAATTFLFHRSQLAHLDRSAITHKLAISVTRQDVTNIASTRHFLAVVQLMYRWGHDSGHLPANPVGTLPKPPTGRRTRIASRSELSIIFRHSSRPFRLFLVIQRHTLARPVELRQLRWRDVDLFNRVLWLSEFKCQRLRRDGLKFRTIPLDAYATRLLHAIRRNRQPASDEPVFLNTLGKPFTSYAVRIAFHRACERAGLNPDGRERLVCYTIRHTSATELTRSGMSDRALADIMGHTSTVTTARYQHLAGEDLVDELDRVRAEGRRRADGRKRAEQHKRRAG